MKRYIFSIVLERKDIVLKIAIFSHQNKDYISHVLELDTL